MRNYPDYMYSNVYPDFDFTHDNHTLPRIAMDVAEIAPNWYVVTFSDRTRERVERDVAYNIARYIGREVRDGRH